MRLPSFAVVLVLAAFAAPAAAQQPPANTTSTRKPVTTPAPTARPAGQPPLPAQVVAQPDNPQLVADPTKVPDAPLVSDPMLAPVPRARIEIATWEEALNHVKSLSTDLRIALATIQHYEAQTTIAWSNAFTTINGQVAYTRNLIVKDLPGVIGGTTPIQDYWSGGLSVAQPVVNFRDWYAIGTARKSEEIGQANLEDTKRQLAQSVANAIVGVVTNERLAELNRVGLENALQRLELAARKTNLGAGTGLDVVRAKQDVETARTTLVTGDENLREAREALGLALGYPEQVGVPPNVDLNGLETSAKNTCKPANNIDERPDIVALQKTIDVQHRGVVDAKLAYAPYIDFRSSLSTTSVSNGLSPATTWNVQGVLTVPIWDGGGRLGNLRDARAQETIAQQKMEAARRQADVQVTQARRAVTVAEDSRRVASTARDLAAENDRLTRASYLEGRGTSLELVTAAQALRQAEIQLAVQDFNLVKARVGAVLALAVCPNVF